MPNIWLQRRSRDRDRGASFERETASRSSNERCAVPGAAGERTGPELDQRAGIASPCALPELGSDPLSRSGFRRGAVPDQWRDMAASWRAAADRDRTDGDDAAAGLHSREAAVGCGTERALPAAGTGSGPGARLRRGRPRDLSFLGGPAVRSRPLEADLRLRAGSDSRGYIDPGGADESRMV